MMVDFETLATTGDAVVLSVGIVFFNRETGDIIEEMYNEFDIISQLIAGRVVSPETHRWWLKTDKEEFANLLSGSNKDNLGSVCIEIEDRIQLYNVQKIWSRGCMDFHILSSLIEGIPHYMAADTRTLDVFEKMDKKNNHYALRDARNQVEHVMKVLNAYKGR
jgi:hypothetical protein